MAFDETFRHLVDIMRPYAEHLDVTHDDPGHLSLDTGHIMKNGKPLFFGAVQIKKNYVSYHLMPVYVNPSLVTDLPEHLLKRMQGKSCFNFKRIEREQAAALAGLTEAGFKDYQAHGFVSAPAN
ncbi:MAG: hypothetical protein AAGB15_05015 [Pseudomonadota bacterium]